MDLKKIKKIPKSSTKKEDRKWMEILSQRNEMVVEIWEEKNKFFKLNLLKDIIIIILVIIIIIKNLSTNIVLIHNRVDNNGAIVGTSTTTKSNMKVGELEIKYFLQKFIIEVRTIPLDKTYYNNLLKEQSIYLTNASQEKLNELIKNDGTLELIQNNYTSNAKIISVNKADSSKNIYQIRWAEEVYNSSGDIIEKNNFIGLFTINFAKLKTEKELLKNPFGILINDFSISKEQIK